MKRYPARRICAAVSVLLFYCISGGIVAQESQQPRGKFEGTLPVIRFDVSPPLKDIPPVPITRAPEELGRSTIDPDGSDGPPRFGPQPPDAAVQTEGLAQGIPGPIVVFDSLNNLLMATPPDPVGDIGPNHYVAMSNLSFQVYSRTGMSVYGPAANNTLWTGFGGSCETENDGDPIVLYDQFADRWILTQFTAELPPATEWYNCIAVSQNGDPTGSWYRWQIANGGRFPDYPKYGIGEEAYYLSTRDFTSRLGTFTGLTAYALDRAALIAGDPNPTIISIFLNVQTVSRETIGDGLLPMDVDGSVWPANSSKHYFLGTQDDGGFYTADFDAINVWEFTVDFTTPANSTFVLADTVAIQPYDTMFPCTGPTGRSCIPQPDTANGLDHQGYRQRPLHRAAYRNFGSHESIVTLQSVEADGGISGMRWWELRSPGNAPFIHQEGTFAPGVNDGIHRWFGSAAMDSAGNIALGYSAGNENIHPSIRYSGRLASDLPGVIPRGEGVIVAGTGSQTGSSRWGDYTSMNIDPTDDCSFWYVNEYVPTTSSTGWRMRVGAFTFEECGSETFSLSTYSASEASICQADEADYDLNLGSVEGYSGSVTLSTIGNPAGASFSVNPVTPPGMSTLTINNTGAVPAGDYGITVQGTDGGTTREVNIDLEVFDSVPVASTPMSPANTAVDVPLTPTFEWNDIGAEAYLIEVATDMAFSNIVYSATTGGNQATPFDRLASSTTHYWRVRGSNACGDGSYSAVSSFTTVSLPGDCGEGEVEVIAHAFDFESGAQGWIFSSALGAGKWILSTANPNSGAQHWHGDDPAPASDHRLSSPVLAIPTGLSNLTFRFFNYQDLEANPPNNCWDGGILEVSTNGGTNFTQVGNADLLTDPYDGAITNGSNPISNQPAWCGQPQPYTDSRVDISELAGEQNVVFRFRIGTDDFIDRPGWDIDDVKVVGCASVLEYHSGFEEGEGQ